MTTENPSYYHVLERWSLSSTLDEFTREMQDLWPGVDAGIIAAIWRGIEAQAADACIPVAGLPGFHMVMRFDLLEVLNRFLSDWRHTPGYIRVVFEQAGLEPPKANQLTIDTGELK